MLQSRQIARFGGLSGHQRLPRRISILADAGNGKRAGSRKGKQFENSKRRRGRPAWLRSPYDSPLRDGNRDRLIGLLTERSVKTLLVYLMETNLNLYGWLLEFYKSNPIPKNGGWDDVSGEAFLRKLLSLPITEARFNTGRESLFDNGTSCGVDPRSMAQRIMDIRTQLAGEFVQELQDIAEENSTLLRETLVGSLSISLEIPAASGDSTAAALAPPTPAAPKRSQDPASRAARKAARKAAMAEDTSASGQPLPPSKPEPGDAVKEEKLQPIAGMGKDELLAQLEAALKKASPVGDHPELTAPAADSSQPAAHSGESKTSSSAIPGKPADAAGSVPVPTAGAAGGSSPTSNEAAAAASPFLQSSSKEAGPLANIVLQLNRALAADSSASGAPAWPELPPVAPPAVAECPADAPASASNDPPTEVQLGAAAVGVDGLQLAAAAPLPRPRLPKGWGPRVLVGAKLRKPRSSQNNIVPCGVPAWRQAQQAPAPATPAVLPQTRPQGQDPAL